MDRPECSWMGIWIVEHWSYVWTADTWHKLFRVLENGSINLSAFLLRVTCWCVTQMGLCTSEWSDRQVGVGSIGDMDMDGAFVWVIDRSVSDVVRVSKPTIQGHGQGLSSLYAFAIIKSLMWKLFRSKQRQISKLPLGWRLACRSLSLAGCKSKCACSHACVCLCLIAYIFCWACLRAPTHLHTCLQKCIRVHACVCACVRAWSWISVPWRQYVPSWCVYPLNKGPFRELAYWKAS